MVLRINPFEGGQRIMLPPGVLVHATVNRQAYNKPQGSVIYVSYKQEWKKWIIFLENGDIINVQYNKYVQIFKYVQKCLHSMWSLSTKCMCYDICRQYIEIGKRNITSFRYNQKIRFNSLGFSFYPQGEKTRYSRLQAQTHSHTHTHPLQSILNTLSWISLCHMIALLVESKTKYTKYTSHNSKCNLKKTITSVHKEECSFRGQSL